MTLSDTAARPSPCLDVGPVPAWATSHCPWRLGQQLPLEPHIHRLSLDAEALGDLLDSYRIGHARKCSESLDTLQRCRYNHYMTQNPAYVPQHATELANTIAAQAEAIRDNRTSARPAAAVKLLLHNVQTLSEWLTQAEAEVDMAAYLGECEL